MFMSSAVLVTLRFKRIASIRVIGKPYALPNGASVRWPAACQLHAPQVHANRKSPTAFQLVKVSRSSRGHTKFTKFLMLNFLKTVPDTGFVLTEVR